MSQILNAFGNTSNIRSVELKKKAIKLNNHTFILNKCMLFGSEMELLCKQMANVAQNTTKIFLYMLILVISNFSLEN